MSVKIQLFKSKPLANGKFPIVIRVNERGERFVVVLPYSCKESEWNAKKSSFNAKYIDNEYATKRIRKYYARAIRAIDKFNDEGIDFSERELFKQLIFESESASKKSKDKMTIKEYLQGYIQRLEDSEAYYQRGNMMSLNNRLFGSKRLKRFFNDYITFSELNVKHLRDYVAFLRKDGMKGGIKNLMKDFRAMYNDAEEEEIFVMKKNPFKLLDFGKFSSDYNPRGLSVTAIKGLLAFDVTKNPTLANSYYTFLFAYYCAGMRFTDLCKISYAENVVDGKIVYKASKTGKMMPPVVIDENIKFLMDKLDTGSGYILPFLGETHKSKRQQFDRVKKCNRLYNVDLKKIGELLGIEVKMTSHVARHSIASVLAEMGATIREIQGVLNHQRSDTTRHYLAKVGHSEISRVHDKLKV